MLKEIVIVTVMVGNLNGTEEAYQAELNYRTVERGPVPKHLAKSWGAPAVAGRKFIVMQPESGEPVYLRFIEDPNYDTEFVSLRTCGWNAIEILTKDPDAVAAKLHRSNAFEVVGEPAWLTDQKKIKAMQAQGPSNELLYLTNIADPESSGFGLESAKSFIDRVFIMVVGGTSLEALRTFYAEKFGLDVTEPAHYRIRVLSSAYDLPGETTHPIAIARISTRFLVELDQYPDGATRRQVANGDLPPGIAMVSFVVDSLDGTGLQFHSPPTAKTGMPYNGRRSATLTGVAGELIELIESSASR